MTAIGINGLGKLGLPVALAIESKGHEVMGYDISPNPEQYLKDRQIPYKEEGLQPLLDNHNVKTAKDLGELVLHSDILFVPVQTPHDVRYEGVDRLPYERRDFDYSYLKEAVSDISDVAKELGKRTTLAVISTCLPGTYEREIKKLTNEYIDYVYTPQFIAMGTVLDDYLNPEFNLIGVESEDAADKLEVFYSTINDAPPVRTDITTAEGIKVSYNTWITAKTVIGNAWGELSEKLGMNFDDMFYAWSLSDKRLLSTKYMRAGMSDGGGCHPRDNIALSWLAKEVKLSRDIFQDLMLAREAYEEWHGDVAIEQSRKHKLPIVILGKAFKPETNIDTGSPAKLMRNIMHRKGKFPQHIEDLDGVPQKAVYFIATQHDRYKDYKFPKGSVVIDPFGYLEPQEGVKYLNLGRK